MTTITEDYCSKEIYRLLIENGFDGEVHTTFDEEGYTQPSITLQMAMKWLREVHNINIDIVSVWNQKRFEYQVFIVTPENAKHCYVDDKLYLVYEQACEAAIKYCLEHLI